MRHHPHSEFSRRRFLYASGLGAAALLSPFQTRAQSNYGIRGRRAPELEIDQWIDAGGESTSFRLSDHDGKWIFLKCWQSWCPGCHSHGFPALKKIADAFAGNAGIAIAGIQTVFEGFSINTADKLRDIQLQYDLRIPMGHDAGDPEGVRHPGTMRNYRTGGTPWMILIDPDRTVVYNEFSINAGRAIEFLARETA